MKSITTVASPLLRMMLLGLLLNFETPLRADPPLASYVFPAGGQRGKSVSLRVGVCNGNEECSWEFAGPGVDVDSHLRRMSHTTWFEGPLLSAGDSQSKEDYPKDYATRTTIADDAPLGIHRWRVWTSQGVTPCMKFVVGDIPEVVEEEIEGEPLAVHVALPVTINGRIFPREDVDLWSFTAESGELITCEVNSARLGYPLHARLEVLDPAGNRITEEFNNLGGDALARFQAGQSGTYQVRIHDIRNGGSQSHVYRLTVTRQTYVDSVYPLGGRAGTNRPFELIGQRIPQASSSVALLAIPSPMRGPTCTWQRFSVGNDLTNPLLIQIDDLPEFLESEAGRSLPNPATIPAVLNGRIRRPGETDEWTFAGKEGSVWHLDLWASRLGSPLDSELTLLDAGGRELFRSDDIAPGEIDSQGVFTVPADGTYVIRIADQFSSRGGPGFAYRLRITPPPAPDFELIMATDALTVLRGSEASIKVSARRFGGFDSDIALKVEGLPPGMSAAFTEIGPNANDVELKFRADSSAQIKLSHLRIRGQAMIAGQSVARSAMLPAPPGEPPLETLTVMVALPTPFKYAGRTSIEYIPRGSSVLWHFRLDRGGFEGPLTVELSDRQFRHLMGLTAPRVTVPAGATEFDYPVQVAPRTLLGRTGRAVIVVSGIVTEPDGSTHFVSFSTHNDDDQVVVLASPPLLTVDTPRKTVVARPGARVQLPLKIGRNARLNNCPVTIELVHPQHVRGVSSRTCTLKPTESSGDLEIEFASGDLGPWNAPVTVRATAELCGQPTIAELMLTVVSE